MYIWKQNLQQCLFYMAWSWRSLKNCSGWFNSCSCHFLFWLYLMHHTVPRGTPLCGATLCPPEVKSCRIIWCVLQREHIVENCCDLCGFKCFQSMQFIHSKSFWTFYCAFYWLRYFALFKPGYNTHNLQ